MGFLKSTQSNPKNNLYISEHHECPGGCMKRCAQKHLVQMIQAWVCFLSCPVPSAGPTNPNLASGREGQGTLKPRHQEVSASDSGLFESRELIWPKTLNHFFPLSGFIWRHWEERITEGVEEGFLFPGSDSGLPYPMPSAYAGPDGLDSWQPIHLLKNMAVLNLIHLTLLQFIMGEGVGYQPV